MGLPIEAVDLPRPSESDLDTVPVEPARGEFHPGQVIEIEPALGGSSQKSGWRRLDESQVIR